MTLNKIVEIDNFDSKLDKFQNIEAEIAIIGCLLWDNKNYEKSK